MNSQQRDWIRNWQQSNGGKYINPKAQALKLLEEVIELCIASGAIRREMFDIVSGEYENQIRKGYNVGEYDSKNLQEEIADVTICLEIIAQYENTTIENEVAKKISILDQRQWFPDENGVLRRPISFQEDYI